MRLINADKLFPDVMKVDGSMAISQGQLAHAHTVEAIPKDQYEARLKADLVAMLNEFDLELYEKYEDTDLIKVKHIRQAIQQKIDKLKEVEQ